MIATADQEDRVVVSKDRDFRDSHLLGRGPRRLLVVNTGNVSNRDLMALVDKHLDDVVQLFGDSQFLELSSDRLIAH